MYTEWSIITTLHVNDINPKKVKLYSVRNRKHKVRVTDFATVPKISSDFKSWLDSFPNILASKDFSIIVDSILTARKKKRMVLAMLGGHVIKTGISPLLIDWMDKGILTDIAMNGSTSIHDFEIAYMGQTSEDVASGLDDGTFGMVRETGQMMHAAIMEGYQKNKGMGESLGSYIIKNKCKFRKYSLLNKAVSLKISITVHTAIGTDTIYQHPDVNGAAMGQTSLTDFYKLVSVLTKLGNGGVVINMGSAVILPEVFLKALTLARNLGYPVKNFTAVNFDMIQHYRPNENVVSRPIRTGGKGIRITGHHEIIFPLLYAAVMARLGKSKLPGDYPDENN